MKTLATTALVTVLMLVTAAGFADPLKCDLTGYKAMPGLTAAAVDEVLTVTWDGDLAPERTVQLRGRNPVVQHTPSTGCE